MGAWEGEGIRRGMVTVGFEVLEAGEVRVGRPDSEAWIVEEGA